MVNGRWVSDQARTGSREEFLPRYRAWIDA